MTEKEAIKEFNKMIGDIMKTKRGISEKQHELFQISMDALEEIQQYRAIGTAEEFREARERQIEKKPIKTPDCSDCEKECNQNCISFSCGETYLCPTCHQNAIFNSEYDMFYKFCKNCGQAIDWSDTALHTK